MATKIAFGTDVAMMPIVASPPLASPSFSCLGIRKSSIPSSTAKATTGNAADEGTQE